MSKKKLTWEEVNNEFDMYEAKFKANASDPDLMHIFNNLSDNAINSDFSKDQLKLIKDRVMHLKQLFAEKQSELVKMSIDAIAKSKQVNTYINNANYKNR